MIKCDKCEKWYSRKSEGTEIDQGYWYCWACYYEWQSHDRTGLNKEGMDLLLEEYLS